MKSVRELAFLLLLALSLGSPGFVAENNLALFNQLFYSATERIVAVSPYFVPDESMLAALVTAARRGVEVELFVSEIGDQFLVFHAQRSYYSVLLEAGVTIWLYRAPTILHAKHVSIDDSLKRPAEVDLLVGDSSKAERRLGWRPDTGFEALIRLMVDADLKLLQG